MTTTLRPAGPETRGADGARARAYTVCVNSRPVGSVRLRTDRRLGPAVGRIDALAVDEGDRRRGRGAVAALAGEEVLRSWGCTRAAVSVPADSPYGLRLAASLGYTERNRHLAKDLTAGDRPALPHGTTVRPLREGELRPWLDRARTTFTAGLAETGVSAETAHERAAATLDELVPGGVPAARTALLGLDHGGAAVAFLWLHTAEPAWVYFVEVDAAHRGRGHGRAAMIAAENHCRDGGGTTLGLNVFLANTTALRLYESLGYSVVTRHFAKSLV
ncbi:GNAT family N-acetyltransferase [Streptomyces sp. V4-01]|uniref:GNAT family N-acetyltransferase n=1 Tax=Actinacidiphila polyblastidii TaxID=3110430 RepID=A0ABU7PAV2_9ACTN|nr:GNAT family N-acetyltransferase [Streptomyces sp. V4-01]